MNEVMTMKELCAYLRVHQSTVYRLLRSGKFPGFRIGADWRFRRDSVDRWMLEKQEQNGNTDAK